MLELVDLSKKFKQMDAVKNLNMFIEKGEIVGLLGPNGAGKSTAISMLSSLVEPTNGDVRFHNKSIIKHPAPLRKVIGVVPQEIALYEDLTAEENMQFFGRIYRLRGVQLKNKTDEVLEQIGLTDRRKDIVKTFSGGMKRRLNIGVAMLHDPEIIIMDEPTVGIDPQSRNYILETVKRLNEEKQMTVLYTSHYMEEVEFLCDRIYIMDQEKTISIKADRWNDAFIEELKQNPTINRVTMGEKEITIIVPREVNLFSKIIRMAENAELELNSVDVQTPTLEDVFLHLTGRALRD